MERRKLTRPHDYSREIFDKGASYTCFGKMKEPYIFTAKKTEDLNEYSSFIDAKPLNCDECGPINRSSNVLWHFQDGSKLGKVKWHEEMRRYY